MSPWQMESVLDVPRNPCLKFGQNGVGNRWYIFWVVVVVFDVILVVILVVVVTGVKQSQLQVSRLKTEVFFLQKLVWYDIWECVTKSES